MNKVRMLMLLMASYIWNFPILWDWRKAIGVPISLVAESKQLLENFISNVCPYAVRIYSSDGLPKMKNIVKTLQAVNCSAVFMQWERSSGRNDKELAKFELLENLAAAQAMDGVEIKIPFFIVCAGILPDELLERTVAINIPCEEDVLSDDFLNLIPDFTDFEEIRDQIRDEKFENEIVEAFVVSAIMLVPKLKKYGKNDLIVDLQDFARQVSYQTRELEESVVIVQEFCDYLISLAEEHFFDNAVHLPNLDMNACKNMDTSIFVRDNELYVSEVKFRDFISQFELPVNYLKHVLKENDIIKCSPGGYTTKMNYITYAGTKERRRMVCINAENICSKDGSIKLSYFIE